MAPATTWRFALAAIAIVIAWRIIAVNAVLYEPDGKPRLPAQASGSERDMLLGILRRDPAEVAALVMLARSHEADSNPEAARRTYAAALGLAPLDREVAGAAAEFFLRRGDAAQALALLDRLAENYPEMRAKIFPALGALATSPGAAQAWKATVARDPGWLGAYVAAACNDRGLDDAFLVSLVLKRASSGRAAPTEAACVIERLRRADRWDEAYQLWLNTLPRERLAYVGYIFNGGFEFTPSGSGFDWIATSLPEREAGHAVETAKTVGAVGARALRVSYNGKRQGGNPIAQFLALAPERYELTGMVRADGLKSVRGAQWVVRCANAAKGSPPLASSERFIGSSEWRRFAFDVAVPSTCHGQLLQLEPVGADEGVTYLAGTLWFDEMALRRRSAAN